MIVKSFILQVQDTVKLFFSFPFNFIIEKAPANQSNLPLKIILPNTQTIQQFTKITKTVSITKAIEMQSGWLGFRDKLFLLI
jgi:hypothetical protein